MKKEEIHLNDIERILFGEAPTAFLMEVLIRTLTIYLMLLVVLRLMGKRMDGQISIIEMAVMIVLGAVVSVGTQIPDRGILPTFVALISVLAFQRGINWLNIKSGRVENATNGTMSILVKDGILQLDKMKASGITKQNLFAILRSRKIFNLGKVKRVYYEACGLINVYEEPHKKAGLPVLPPGEKEFIRNKTTLNNEQVACRNCGYVDSEKNRIQKCKNCGAVKWMEAIY
jgi:uncharacterized membrane protein YcaP (DUF421 family)